MHRLSPPRQEMKPPRFPSLRLSGQIIGDACRAPATRPRRQVLLVTSSFMDPRPASKRPNTLKLVDERRRKADDAFILESPRASVTLFVRRELGGPAWIHK